MVWNSITTRGEGKREGAGPPTHPRGGGGGQREGGGGMGGG